MSEETARIVRRLEEEIARLKDWGTVQTIAAAQHLAATRRYFILLDSLTKRGIADSLPERIRRHGV